MANNKFILFNGSIKMSDAILTNYTLLSILPRFNIKLGFGDKSIKEVCKDSNADLQLFLLICNTHSFNQYLPSKKEIDSLNIDNLVNYLRNSHNYYINYRIKEISKKLTNLQNKNNIPILDIVKQFFDEYKQEVLKHFQYEDKIVFPYIKEVVKGNTNPSFNITQYEDNHSNIDDKLSDLKNILIKYLPQSIDSKERADLLTDIFLFEEDLTKHTIIEDKILIPYVTRIEKNNEK